MPPSAWAGWICFESEVEVEAAKGELYSQLMLRVVQLSSEVYSSCGGEGLQCNVPYRRRSLNCQYPHCVKPLKICREPAISPCLTGPVGYLFASRHKGHGLKSPGGGTHVKLGFSC
jgi:hypothetical protein